ncbi:MAG: aminodeoxychorismate lyase [Halieaceae bacterium]
MPLPVHWVNCDRSATLNPADRGFLYGDGLFETIRIHAGKIHLLPLHLARLRQGCQVLDIALDEAVVLRQLELALDYLEQHSIADAACRLALSRGVGERGYGGTCGESTVVLSLSTASAWREPAAELDIIICETALAAQPLLAGIKHSNRLEQVLAARELERRGAAEGLMLNYRGEIVCAVAANVFALFEGSLLTPPIADCGIAGTVRQLILDELGPAAGLDVTEQPFTSADLQQAQELFLTGSIVGIRSVASCGDQRFTSTRWGDTLRSSFYEWSETS